MEDSIEWKEAGEIVELSEETFLHWKRHSICGGPMQHEPVPEEILKQGEEDYKKWLEENETNENSKK